MFLLLYLLNIMENNIEYINSEFIQDIKCLISKSNFNNKKLIIDLIKDTITENSLTSINLVNINKINKNFFKSNKIKESNMTCSICQFDILSKQHKIRLHCNHIFHKKCLNKCFENKLLNFSCPNCKYNYSSNLKNIIN